MIKLVAFDWNGTLLSDTAVCVRAENAALKAVGVRPITIRRFQEIFNVPIASYWKILGLSESFLKKHTDSVNGLFYSIYEKNVNHTRTRSGVKETLNFLESRKILKVIYSNHNIPNIKRQLVRLKIDRLFNEILAQSQQISYKHVFFRHKDQLLNRFVKEHKLKSGEVISVGDTEEEIQIGKTYGYRTVALTGGWNTAARLKKQHPDFLIHNMAELKKIVKQLNQ